jgi:hypothetical protein
MRGEEATREMSSEVQYVPTNVWLAELAPDKTRECPHVCAGGRSSWDWNLQL